MEPTTDRPQVLLMFTHGLGDAIQLTSVLLHLRHYHPEWDVDVASLIGKDSAFHGLARQSLILDCDPINRDAYDLIYSLAWWECDRSYSDSPSTKAERCVRDVFKLAPLPELCRYQINVRAEAAIAASSYFDSIGAERGPDGRYKALVLHYQGNTALEQKNLNHETAKAVCEVARRAGWIPVVLDWDRRSPLPNGEDIFCPMVGDPLWKGYGTGDTEHIAALINLASLFVGVDSGPQKIAGATDTPALAVWTGHHPVHYFGLAANVVHVCPENARRLIRGDWRQGDGFFQKHYRHKTYINLTRDLISILEEQIGAHAPRTQELISFANFWVRSANISQDLLVVRDVYDNDAYRTALHLERLRTADVIVDVGAHIGAFARLCHERNPRARIICVEACPENINALRMNVGTFAEVIHAACTYETQPVGLLNSVRPNCEGTGGSRVVPLSELDVSPAAVREEHVWRDRRFLPTVTLEDLLRQFGLERISLLKLDCEGSEISILRGTPSLDRIDYVMGEYHDEKAWHELREERLRDWGYVPMSVNGGSGVFHLRNPCKR